MKRLFLVLVAILVSGSTSVIDAAKPNFGIKAGVSLYTVSVASDPADMGLKPGFTAGVNLDVPVLPKSYETAQIRPFLRCDAFYTMKGMTVTSSNANWDHSYGQDPKFTTSEIAFGSMLGIKTNTDPVFYAAAGLELGFALYSRATFQVGESDSYFNLMEDTNSPELSYLGELGAEIPLYGKTWIVGLRGTYGHTTIYDEWSSAANMLGIQCLVGLTY